MRAGIAAFLYRNTGEILCHWRPSYCVLVTVGQTWTYARSPRKTMAVFFKGHAHYDEDRILNLIWFGLVGLQVTIVLSVAARAARHYFQRRLRKQVLP
ncbi:uncharacterized protein UV8b_07987 [Ustilaginoidea virens]|uniref:Uncharacterized protein n=1 Tax=Ustilaginoidea virens TaxID=1159556 RepID=A0A8E5ML40_USTVR|nr:uncharacterized protein UV8b_07987 [Ustilaginoidea virens]QUC23746.1 hypothetical protein UV8b_07987 [Ustilaginoidea virens]